jgi:hypothetical protein
MLAGQHRLEAFLDQLLTGPGNRVRTGVQSRGDPAVAPSLAGPRGVGLQQDTRPRQQPRRVLAHMDQRAEALTLGIAQLHHILLYGNPFRGHDASPPLRSHRF